jgi:endo-1,4-beta-xylanase
MNRRTFLKTSAALSTLLLENPLLGAEKKKVQLSEEEILAQCKARILKHRMGDGKITVRSAKGKRIKNASVKIEQLSHDFLFGSTLALFGRCSDSHLEIQYCERFAALLNLTTLGFYWASYEPERGKPNYVYTDKVVEWAGARGIHCKGHPLVWDYSGSSPNWLPEDLKEVERLSKARVREIVSRYKGRIDIWDVVNEATHLYEIKDKSRMDEMAISMGQSAYVAEHLKSARTANPAATLLVNDYKIDPAYYLLLDSLRENKKLLFNTVGIQSHMHRGIWPLQKVWSTCDIYAKLGLPIHFTETTVLSGKRIDKENYRPSTPEGEAAQADYVKKFYTALFAHPSVQAVTWWDFSDYGAWRKAPSGLLRADMSPKPVYDKLMSLIKGEWWTKTEGHTNWLGHFATRAFYGTHRITAKLPNGMELSNEVHWERGKANCFELIAG